jgi:hypothetical protein
MHNRQIYVMFVSGFEGRHNVNAFGWPKKATSKGWQVVEAGVHMGHTTWGGQDAVSMRQLWRKGQTGFTWDS